VAAGFVGTADAGRSNTFIVEKVVVGPVPADAVFTVEVTCQDIAHDSSSAAPAADPSLTVQFDANGVPMGENTLSVNFLTECTAVETVTNGAAVTYECAVEAPPEAAPDAAAGAVNGQTLVECTDDQTVVFHEVGEAKGTVTVTNTFQEVIPDDVAPAADAAPSGVVAARPSFTG
jgi:hypothetical protein